MRSIDHHVRDDDPFSPRTDDPGHPIVGSGPGAAPDGGDAADPSGQAPPRGPGMMDTAPGRPPHPEVATPRPALRLRWLPAPPPPEGPDSGLDVDACVALATAERFSGRRVRVGGVDGIAKGGRIAPSGSRRHGLRRLLLAVPAPAEREFRHLRWLRARLFHAPAPLLALTVDGRLGPVGQLLVTATLPDVVPLDAAWGDASAREELAREVGAELGRLHALHFLHGDAYARNLLVSAAPAEAGPGFGRRIAFVDAWMGGPTPWRAGTLRPLERDLGCLLCDGATWMGTVHELTVLRAYLAARAANGRPVRAPHRWLERVRAARLREVRRLLRRPERLRGRPAPAEDWDVNARDLA